MPRTAAIILGASGSVGRALLTEAVQPGRFSQVIVLTRRPQGLTADLATRVVERQVPKMDPQHLQQAVVDALAQCDSPAVGFSVLGVGAGTAKLSLQEHLAVDVDLNAAFAAGLKASGKVRHLAFMSAIGANINAKTTGSGAAGMPRYARVKAEAEQAVLSQGPEGVSIFRPSVIIGSQHTPRSLGAVLSLLSPLLPTRYRAITATQIAQAMVAVALTEAPTRAIYTYAEMKTLGAGLV